MCFKILLNYAFQYQTVRYEIFKKENKIKIKKIQFVKFIANSDLN